jgi:uncharacterized SAM-binding protein YcdF (DUF218 family)
MFILKQFLKVLVLPPMSWILLLTVVLIFWRRRWARALLGATLLLVVMLHSGLAGMVVRYHLESQHAPLIDPKRAGRYDAIVVLTGGFIPAGGLIPFPSVREEMFRRLDEAWRLYRIQPKPIVVSGGHVDPFTRSRDENKIAIDYLLLWGVPKAHLISEAQSRDTFESAIEVKKIVEKKGWKRYLLVTSAIHMPRSMLVFKELAPDPVAAPGDFMIGATPSSPLDLFPTEEAARRFYVAIHEYIGLANYYWRLHFHATAPE